jgi:hypothetical protein
MALLFLDSFDHYVTADAGEKWTGIGGAIVAGAGRRSTAAWRSVSSGQSAAKTLAPGDTTCLLGVAMKVPAYTVGNLVQVRSAATAQITVTLNATGFFEVRRGTSTGTLLGTASASISAGVFIYLELKTRIDPTTGTVTLRVNETLLLSVPSANTASTGVAGWDGVALGGTGSGNYDYDDLYVLDGTGAAPLNDLLGDCRVDARYPTAEGASSAWTPLSGTNNALMVDETAPDDDTTYNSTPTVGATDTHVVQDAPVPGAALYGVQLCLSHKKSDAGTCSLAPVVRHGTTDYPGTAFNPGTTYVYQVIPYGLNPGTAAAWTEADFNAAEFGYKRTA